MGRRLAAIACAVALAWTSWGTRARADDAAAAPPSAERIRSAADEYDKGRRAFLAGAFEQSAVHFENAYHDAPRAEALRSAIRARRAAKQNARAATLASLAELRYGSDPPTMALVNETITELSPQLLGVNLACDPECGVAADGRVVTMDDARQVVFYLDPGKHDLVVSWSGDRSRRVTLEGAAGSVQDLSFVAPPPRAGAPQTPAVGARAATAVDATSGAAPSTQPTKSTKPFGPAVFVTGVALTGVGLAATIVSGVATLNDPGADAVRRDCVGQGESCPTYQRGKSAELRTNVLAAATGVVGVATAVVGLFFTRWGGRARPTSGFVAPRVDLSTDRADIGVVGRF